MADMRRSYEAFCAPSDSQAEIPMHRSTSLEWADRIGPTLVLDISRSKCKCRGLHRHRRRRHGLDRRRRRPHRRRVDID